jgi:drug/metabolite transporter (DMT)-like permease
MMSLEPYVLLVLVGSFLEGLGATLQKHGVATRKRKPAGGPLAGLRSVLNPIWCSGVLIMIVGAGFSIQGLADGQVTVAVPLSTVSMLVAIVLGTVALSERLSRAELGAIAGLLLGTALLILSATPPAPALREVAPLAPIFGAALAAVLALVVVARRIRGRAGAEVLLALAAGLLMGFANTLTKVAADRVRARHGSFELVRGEDLGVLLTEPVAAAVVLSILFSFAIVQLAFTTGRVSVVAPVRLTVQIATAVALGALLLGESIPTLRGIGIVVVSASAVALLLATRAAALNAATPAPPVPRAADPAEAEARPAR